MASAAHEDGWVPVALAAERLGLAVGYVRAGRRTGRFPVVRRDGADWLRVEDVDRLAGAREVERAEFVSYAAAAEIAGCSHIVVERAVAEGEIAQRSGERHRGQPSLCIEAVQEWAVQWKEQQQVKAVARDARQAERVERRRLNQPPDTEHVWLDAKTAAIAVGVTVGGLRTMAATGRVAHERVGRRVWFRRDHLEQWLAARAAAPRFKTGL